MEHKLDKKTVGFTLSYAYATIFSALLVILKETYEPIKDAMKALTGHHWATHGLLTLLVFFILGYVFAKDKYLEKYDEKKLTNLTIWSTVIATILITGYFLIHTLAS
ncbi:hypothetical protein BHF71_06165 [Vulcanibacillus modesticaldus]|uniref:Uncharacterized protein n=1 Tax=Vulcanibacillus modesticaldus TaxID=337097 RepID=A0A1D2YWW1_9BACI|nr:hypothetical protein [Vulcanibacillus modesticaldus]OEG00107.1 hypothetical protein BHF71_06165 [Vulcanibacillus modesticaldus]